MVKVNIQRRAYQQACSHRRVVSSMQSAIGNQQSAISNRQSAGMLPPEGRQQRRSRQQLAQDNRSRNADALASEVELLERVLAQGDERDATEVGERLVLEHHLREGFSALADDVIVADAARREFIDTAHRRSSEAGSNASGWVKSAVPTAADEIRKVVMERRART